MALLCDYRNKIYWIIQGIYVDISDHLIIAIEGNGWIEHQLWDICIMYLLYHTSITYYVVKIAINTNKKHSYKINDKL